MLSKTNDKRTKRAHKDVENKIISSSSTVQSAKSRTIGMTWSCAMAARPGGTTDVQKLGLPHVQSGTA